MRIFSGIKPSGDLHLGNYIGALSQWIALQDAHECIYCVVDLHALTVAIDPSELRRRTLDAAAWYLALGLDPKKSTLFVQSHVSAHAELGWILNTIAKISELKAMHQFKEKSKSNPDNINMGLFDYPVLMASDILLYDTEGVPVGEDQKQHVELVRELARRFNGRFGETFTVPKSMLMKHGARVMALDNPAKKMEKTGSVDGYIALSDTPDLVKKKIKRAVTDSGREILFDAKKKPALANLLTIYHLLSGQAISDIEKAYAQGGYKEFKDGLARVLIEFLAPVQERYGQYRGDENNLRALLADGASRAKKHAEKKMIMIKRRIGLYE
ncbi:tryptophan--tRNA ligase [Candidatus Uhrbacteria bacterium]|nr:tryptophan--tRNA ligase [Candidatus Uhrbacteria bacterium]